MPLFSATYCCLNGLKKQFKSLERKEFSILCNFLPQQHQNYSFRYANSDLSLAFPEKFKRHHNKPIVGLHFVKWFIVEPEVGLRIISASKHIIFTKS